MMMMMMMMMIGHHFNGYRLSGAALFWLRVLVLGLSTEQQDKQTDKDRVGLGTGPQGQGGIDIHSGKEGLGEEVAERPDVYRGGGGGGGEEGCTRPADRCEVTDAVHHPRALPHPAVLHHRQHAVVPGNRGREKRGETSVNVYEESLSLSLSLSLTYITSLWVTRRSSPSSPWPLWPWPDSCTYWAQTGRQTHTCWTALSQ